MNRSGVLKGSAKALTNKKLYHARLLLRHIQAMKLRTLDAQGAQSVQDGVERQPPIEVVLLESVVAELYLSYQSLLKEMVDIFKLQAVDQGPASAVALQSRLIEQGLNSAEIGRLVNLERGQGQEGDWLQVLIAQFEQQSFCEPSVLPASVDSVEDDTQRSAQRIPMAPHSEPEALRESPVAEPAVQPALTLERITQWHESLKALIEACRAAAAEW